MNFSCRDSSQNKQVAMHMLMITFVLLTTSVASEEFPMAKHGCKDKCGNVTIPYPFGMTEDCCYGEGFLITCDHTFHPPKPSPSEASDEILEISLDGKARIMGNISWDCYDESGHTSKRNGFLLLTSFYVVSITDNVFVAIGCDTNATLTGYESGHGYTVGCTSKCDDIDYVPNDTCNGIGCCQTSLAKGVSNLSLTVGSFNNHKGILGFNPCSYAFVVDKTQFNFSKPLLKDLKSKEKLPTVVEWSVGGKDCETEKRSEKYACQGNSTCYDITDGYRCRCKDGYGGNPYLPSGCQDINECKNATLDNCTERTICVNTPGSYECHCPEGHLGDGRKDGVGCIAIPNRSLERPLTLGCSIGLGIPLLVATIWLLYKIVKRRNEKKRREEFFRRNGGLLLEQQVSSGDGVEMPIKLFTSKELERATDNYNENRILGRGGQGTVYKGMIEDGRVVAIKKSKKIDQSQLGPFINEVVVLQQINHRNIVKLLGCCLETEVPMLVYEFIPNGMLSHYLHCQNEEFPMTWDMRLRIAVEVADALSYLHSAASHPIYHCDIKSANILLDEKYRAKIADFGIARSIDLDQTHLTTPNVQGTFGYLDPEYFRTSQFTDKSDVYSFGVVLAELLTGQKPISSTRSEYERSLVNYFLVAMEEDRLFDIVDIRVVKEGPEEAIAAMAKLAQRCLNMTGRKRPTMREVVTELQSLKKSQEVSTKRDDEQVEVEHYNDISGSCEAISTSTRSYLDSGSQSLCKY